MQADPVDFRQYRGSQRPVGTAVGALAWPAGEHAPHSARGEPCGSSSASQDRFFAGAFFCLSPCAFSRTRASSARTCPSASIRTNPRQAAPPRSSSPALSFRFLSMTSARVQSSLMDLTLDAPAQADPFAPLLDPQSSLASALTAVSLALVLPPIARHLTAPAELQAAQMRPPQDRCLINTGAPDALTMTPSLKTRERAKATPCASGLATRSHWMCIKMDPDRLRLLVLMKWL